VKPAELKIVTSVSDYHKIIGRDDANKSPQQFSSANPTSKSHHKSHEHRNRRLLLQTLTAVFELCFLFESLTSRFTAGSSSPTGPVLRVPFFSADLKILWPSFVRAITQVEPSSPRPPADKCANSELKSLHDAQLFRAYAFNSASGIVFADPDFKVTISFPLPQPTQLPVETTLFSNESVKLALLLILFIYKAVKL
jgi:hypothetical protein